MSWSLPRFPVLLNQLSSTLDLNDVPMARVAGMKFSKTGEKCGLGKTPSSLVLPSPLELGSKTTSCGSMD